MGDTTIMSGSDNSTKNTQIFCDEFGVETHLTSLAVNRECSVDSNELSKSD